MKSCFKKHFLIKVLTGILKKKKLVLLLSITITILTAVFTVYSTQGYEVRVDNKYIGEVRSKSIVQNALDNIINIAENKYKTKIVVSSQITYKKVFFINENKIEDNNVLESLIKDNVKLNSQAFAINVDGRDIAFLQDRDSAEEVLSKVKEPYYKEGEDSVDIEFEESVSIVEREVPLNKLKDPKEVFDSIILKSNEIKKYTVEEGDTISEVAEELGLNIEDIKKANPGISIDNISIGQELNLIASRYAINVKKKVYKATVEKIPFKVEYMDTEELYRGDIRTKIEGKNGSKLVKHEIVSVNGFLEDTNTISELVLQVPKTEIVLRGTRERPRTVATGEFSMPSRGGFSSSFGERWGRQHNGIDIAVPKGTPNKASDGGVVIFAGWRDGYGKLIIIDHENGLTTYYAHNDTIKVKNGQRVAKDDVIGTAGTTGRVTGPHLHFEVRKKGVPVNPLKYLK